MQFVTGLLGVLHDDRAISVVNAAEGVYAVTLKPFHGFFTSTAFAVALKVRKFDYIYCCHYVHQLKCFRVKLCVRNHAEQ